MYFAGLILICVMPLAVSFGVLFYRAAQTHEMAALRDNAYLVAGLFNQGSFEYVDTLEAGGTRVTLISPYGWLLWDSHAGADFDVNRGNRKEFVQAITYGSGEAIRSSDTLGAETFYYAIRLLDGNVLRFSRTLYSLGEMFVSSLPILVIVTFVILALAQLAAHRLTLKIIRPLTRFDFDNTEIVADSTEVFYEELWPYIKKIDHQKQEIADQMIALRNRAETIEAIIANMREGLVILDEFGLVIAANKSVLDIFEIAHEDDIAQKNIRHICRDPELARGVKQCLDGVRLEKNFTRNGRVYNVFLSPAISNESGLGAIVLFLDITEQFKAEVQRKEFTANVSHELKTPLTTILALSEMMANGMAKADDVEGFSTKISSHARRLMNIIEDIIRLSEFDEDKAQKDFVMVDVYKLAKLVIATLQEKAAENAVTIELTGQPLQIKANRHLLDELIFNLIDNGINYNKESGKIVLDICKENSWCKISVIDTGIGISKEHQGRIFERFYRVDSSRSKKTGGTG